MPSFVAPIEAYPIDIGNVDITAPVVCVDPVVVAGAVDPFAGRRAATGPVAGGGCYDYVGGGAGGEGEASNEE